MTKVTVKHHLTLLLERSNQRPHENKHLRHFIADGALTSLLKKRTNRWTKLRVYNALYSPRGVEPRYSECI